MLLIDGDLELHGSFSRHGIVIVSGSIIFTGGGNKNITGALMAGGPTAGDVVGGNTNIRYCSTAIADQTETKPFKLLRWLERM